MASDADERAELQTTQQHVGAQLAAVVAELIAARKAARTREVELLLDTRAKLLDTRAKLLDTRAKLHDTRAKLAEKEVMQLALQVEAARRAPLPSAGAPSCERS